MIETQISITVNRKSDIALLEQKIIENQFQFPVYIREYEFSYQINFTSDYEEWELDTAILSSFPGYEFTTDLERGRKEIRIQISRYQSELSTDGWGRRIENPLNETKYLIKTSINKAEDFNPKIKVLFEDQEQFYHINIVDGINTTTDEKGFLLLDDFKTNNEGKNAEILPDRLYKSRQEAFQWGFDKISDVVENDFTLYIENKKKEIREIQKLPRKIIREFIKACNNADEDNIVKQLDEDIIFEVRKHWKTIFETKGIPKFKEYLSSSEQELSGKDFKIRSSWSFKLPYVTIGVKYFPISNDTEKQPFQKYRQISFTLKDNMITSIIDES